MSTSDTFIRQIRDLIAGGNLDESLRLLRALLQNTPHLNEAIQQSGRYADICRQARLGTVGDSDATRTQNQIRLGVLELLSELERQGGEPGLDGLLVAMEEAGKRSELQQEVTKAISVVNSKNLVVASTIQAGSVHIGDNIYIGRPSDLSPESLSRQTTLQKIQPVSLKTIRNASALRWHQRLFFGFQKKRTRQELALKAQGIFDADERRFFLNALQHYLPLNCRVENDKFPCPFADTFFQTLNEKENDGNFYLLLGETGAGKSTALLELFTRFALAPRQYDIVFANFGKALDPIFQLPNPEKIILLLDGIDEAPEMQDDPEAFFAKVENSARNFAKVIISCRTQFFVNKAAERAKTSTNPPKNYHKVYLDFLEMEAVQHYLGNFYRPGTPDYTAALVIVRQAGNLFKRPLLLSYIRDMVEKKDGLLFFNASSDKSADAGTVTQYEIYETILEKWMEREALLNPMAEGEYSRVLYAVSMKLAQALFYQEGRKYVYYSDLKNIAEKYRLPISDTLLRDRSLLHRNEPGYYNFAHRTFKEFFFAQMLYDGLLSEEEFPFDAYEDAGRFYNEMGEVRYYQRLADKTGRRNHRYGNIPFPPVKNTCLPRPLIAFCHLEGIPVSEKVTSLFEHFLRKNPINADHLDCLTDLAEYLVKVGVDTVDEEYMRNLAGRYDVHIGDLLGLFFFCRKGDAFHFIHRSFAEYLCLRDVLFEEDPDEAADAAARFPVDRLRFQHLFEQELRWLRFLPYRSQVSLCLDHYDVSKEDFQQSEALTWYDYYLGKADATLFDFFQRLERGKGRLVVRALQPTGNGFLACIPFAGQVRELNLAQNDLQGEIGLEHFTQLETLDIAGNPALRLSALPASLKGIVADKKQADTAIPAGFKGAVQYREDVVQRLAGGGSFMPEMVEVKGGRFWMGSAEEDRHAQQDERPRHLAEVSDFFVGKYPVTVRKFACFVQATGYVTQAEREGWAIASWWDNSGLKNTLTWFLNAGTDWTRDVYGKPMDEHWALHPVIYVSWYDAQAYCAWLSQKTGKRYSLPSEAQWEYAAIGGQLSGRRDAAGNIAREFEYAGSDDLNEVAWNFDRLTDSGAASSQFGTRPVGSLKPNQLGLNDMSGNVLEWCQDWLGDYPANPEKDYAGPIGGSYRVVRGGGWDGNPEYCRVAYRNRYYPGHRYHYLGFRLVFVP